ncbi:MAG: TIGR00266 family protein [Nitrososphaeria archaeon]
MVEFDILGNDLQYVRVKLNPGESIYGDAGHMLTKSETVSMQTIMKGGFLGALKREVTGSTFFVTQVSGPGEAAFAGIFPGKIFQINIDRPILAEAHSFLVAENTVNYESQMAKLSAGIFGGEGLFLAKFTGSGRLFLHAYGALDQITLQAGEKIQVEASHLLAFQSDMKYGISRVGGLKSMLFSHEGLFFVDIEGPGAVWVHSLTTEQLAQALIPYLPAGGQRGGVAINL